MYVVTVMAELLRLNSMPLKYVQEHVVLLQIYAKMILYVQMLLDVLMTITNVLYLRAMLHELVYKIVIMMRQII